MLIKITHAHSVCFINLIAVVTSAHKATERIGTATILTQVVHFRTFIDIFQNNLQTQI